MLLVPRFLLSSTYGTHAGPLALEAGTRVLDVRAIVPRGQGCVKPKIGGEGLSAIERDVELPHGLLGFASGVVKEVAVRLVDRPARLVASAAGRGSGHGRRGAGDESGRSRRSGRSDRSDRSVLLAGRVGCRVTGVPPLADRVSGVEQRRSAGIRSAGSGSSVAGGW